MQLTWKKSEKSEKYSESSPKNENITSHNSFREQCFQSPMSTINETYEFDQNSEVGNSDFWSPTPPASRSGRSRTPNVMSGSHKSSCLAKTRLGTPCKLSSLPGRDFCHRHQNGSSVIMS